MNLVEISGTAFLDICKIVNRKPSVYKREKNEGKRDRLDPITKEELLDLLNNKFHTLNELQQRNVKIYIQNNVL